MSFVYAGLALVVIGLAGFGLLRCILGGRMTLSLFGLIPLSFGVGLGALALLGNLTLLVGLRLPWAYAPFLALALGGVLGLRGATLDRVGMMRVSGAGWVFVAAILFGAASVLILSLASPLHAFDARAIWATKAKMLFYSGTLSSPDFTDPLRLHPHTRYPLLFPMSEAFLFWLIGGPDDWAVMPLIGLFFPLLLFFSFEMMRLRCVDINNALAAPALVAVLPALYSSDGPPYSGYADTPLAMLCCLAFGTTLRWRETRDGRMLVLAAFLSGLLPLTKNEGLWLAGLNLLLAILPGRASSPAPWTVRRTAASVASCLAPLIAILLPWFLLRSALLLDQDPNDPFLLSSSSLLEAHHRLPTVLEFCSKALTGLQPTISSDHFAWGLFWVLFAIAALIAARLRHTDALLLAGVVLVYFMLLAAAYCVIPTHTPESFMTKNFFRLCFPIVTVAAFQIALTWDALNRLRP
ncbi:MAG: hypothetical protein AB1486_16760 [Planctomycetota bacterium]